ncbi:MAG TPA: hypothetical protein VFO34_13625 [Candidatus Acidoferrales bacterium]|nr:hypothetical protein [Candidatus Acidoferrales bacterium]
MPEVIRTARAIAVSALGCLISASATGAAPKGPLGIVVAGQRATVGDVPVAASTSIYEGDSVATQQKGFLQIRLEAAQLLLSENGSASLHRADRGIYAELSAGTLRFSGTPGVPIEIRALGAVIRGSSDASAGQIVVVGPSEFRIGATMGSLTVNVDGDIRTVTEGTAYDAVLDSDDPQGPIPTAKRRRLLYWIIVPLILAGTIIPVIRATMSPSKMH